MPQFRKMHPEEMKTVSQRPLSPRARIAQEYDALLADFSIGDYGSVDLAVGDNRLTTRNRLRAAARRRGMDLRFRPGPNTALIFQVLQASPGQPRPARTVAARPAPAAPAAEPIQAAPATPAPAPRNAASDRWGRMLPRWMREGERAPNGRAASSGRRRTR